MVYMVVSNWVGDKCIELMACTDIDTAPVGGASGADLGHNPAVRPLGQDDLGEWYGVSPV
jgi:hypothetical protein